MTNKISGAVDAVALFALYAAASLLALSMGTLSGAATDLIHLLAACAFVLAALSGAARRCFRWNLAGTWFGTFLFWLLLQQTGIWLRLSFFATTSSWINWLTQFPIFFTGFILYGLAGETLASRTKVMSFLRFFVLGFAAVSLCFVCTLFVSNKPVEGIRFPVMEFFQPVGPAAWQPNDWVDLMIPAFFFAVALALYHQRRRLNHPDPRRAAVDSIGFLSAAAVLMAAVVFSRSRGGILGFLAGLFVCVVLLALAHRRRFRVLKHFSLLLFGSILFLGSLGLREVVQEVSTVAAELQHEWAFKGTRLMTIATSWHVVQRVGFMGAGVGNFYMGWLLHHQPPFLWLPLRSYNDYLWMAAEAGIPGALLFVLTLGAFFLKSAWLSLKTQSCLISYTLIAAISATVAFSVHALLDPTFYVPSLFWIVCLTWGVAAACRHVEDDETEGASARRWSRFRPLFLAAASIGCIGVAILAGGRFAAEVAASDGSESQLRLAARLDPLSAYYPTRLAQEYERQFRHRQHPLILSRAVSALENAINRRPFKTDLYRRQAEMCLKRGDYEGVRESFNRMREKLPGFYGGELTAAAFYIESSLRMKDEGRRQAYEILSLRHYLEALKYYPGLSKENDLTFYLTAAARQRFNELLSEKQILKS